MLVDELKIHCTGGKGGDGSVHFARRKYQPFGGPDGGDGGLGGSVAMLGRRDTDTMSDLRVHVRRFGPFKAEDGKPGAGNLMIGADAAHTDLAVPLGTLAYRVDNGEEIGFVQSSGERVVLARGGRGGRGNPKFATGQLRAPKHAENGKPGDDLDIRLLYRIYADTMLLEPLHSPQLGLLPLLTGRSAAELDYELYLRKPRWLRVEQDYQLYDVAYLPLLCNAEDAELAQLEAELAEAGELREGEASAEELSLSAPTLQHLYWAQHCVVNLLPLGASAAELWALLKPRLLDTPLRRLNRLVVLAPQELFEPWTLETDEGQAEVLSLGCESDDAMLLAAFQAELCGGVVQ